MAVRTQVPFDSFKAWYFDPYPDPLITAHLRCWVKKVVAHTEVICT